MKNRVPFPGAPLQQRIALEIITLETRHQKIAEEVMVAEPRRIFRLDLAEATKVME